MSVYCNPCLKPETVNFLDVKAEFIFKTKITGAQMYSCMTSHSLVQTGRLHKGL